MYIYIYIIQYSKYVYIFFVDSPIVLLFFLLDSRANKPQSWLAQWGKPYPGSGGRLRYMVSPSAMGNANQELQKLVKASQKENTKKAET